MNPQVEDEVRKMIIEGIDILVEHVLAPRFVDMSNKIASLEMTLEYTVRRIGQLEDKINGLVETDLLR